MPNRTTKVNWDEAFAFFAALDPADRSYGKVAERFGVSDTSVGKRARADKWLERTRELDRKASARAERTIERSRAERIADTVRLAEALQVRFAEQLSRGDTVRGQEVVAFLKFVEAVDPESSHSVGRADLDAYIAQVAEVCLHHVPFKQHEAFIRDLEALRP